MITSITARLYWSLLSVLGTFLVISQFQSTDIASYGLAMSVIALPLAFGDSLFGVAGTLHLKRNNGISPLSALSTRKISVYLLASFTILFSFCFVRFDFLLSSTIILLLVLAAFVLRDYFIRMCICLERSNLLLVTGLCATAIFLSLFFFVKNFTDSFGWVEGIGILAVSSAIPILFVSARSYKTLRVGFKNDVGFESNDFLLMADNLANWLRYQASLFLAAVYFDDVVIAGIFAARLLISPLLFFTPIISAVLLPKFAGGTKEENAKILVMVSTSGAIVGIVYSGLVSLFFDALVTVFTDLDSSMLSKHMNLWLIAGVLYIISPVFNSLFIGELRTKEKLLVNLFCGFVSILGMIVIAEIFVSDMIIIGLITSEVFYIALLYYSRIWR